MSYAANPNRPSRIESQEAAAAKQLKADKERIRKLIITLGDDKAKVVGQIRGLAGALQDDLDMHGELMMDTVLECVQHLPLKTAIFAAWLTRMRQHSDDWACTAVDKAYEALRVALRAGRLTTASLLLRFVVSLGCYGFIDLTGAIGLVNEVLALSEGMKPGKGGDLGIFVALSALPYLSTAAYKLVADQVDSFLTIAATYMASRGQESASMYRLLRDDGSLDRLEALLADFPAHKEASWASQVVFHVPGFQPILEPTKQTYTVEPLGIKAEDIRKAKIRVPIPLMTCRLLTGALQTDGEDDQLSGMDRWMLECNILSTLEMFGKDIEECSRQLLRIHVRHPHFEAICIETVVSQMLRLPNPLMLPVFYSRLLTSLVQKQETMKSLVEQSFKTLMNRCSELDEEVLDVLSEEFGFWLTSTELKWDWATLSDENLPAPTQRFLRRTFERVMRLTFHDNLVTHLPQAMHRYIPENPLAASSALPLQAKPQFAKMLGVLPIKDPSEQRVLDYCNHLLKLKAKEEEPAAPPQCLAPPVEPAPREAAEEAKSDAASENGEEAPGDGAKVEGDEGPAAKRRKLDATPGIVEVSKEEEEETPSVNKEGPPAKKRKLDNGDGAGDNEGKASPDNGEAEKPERPVKEETKDLVGEASAEPWKKEEVVELFTLALLQNGHRSPTHMQKMLDGYQAVYAQLMPDDDEEKQQFTARIVKSVFGFWQASSLRLEMTLETMLGRGLVTSASVIESSLASCASRGDSLVVWNVVHSVIRKSLERSTSVRVELANAKKLEKEDVMEKCRKQLDKATHDTAELFTIVFTGLVRNYQDLEGKDANLRQITLRRMLAIGRKYHAFIRPLIEAAESRIPGVAHNPDVLSVFQQLKGL